MSEHQEVNKKRLGELVTEAYKAVGNTRQGMAPLVGISERSMYMIENGLSIPRAHTQRKLEEVLGWRKGAIADVLGLGPDADVSKVSLSFMQESKNSAWADMPDESDTELAQRLSAAAVDMTVRLREKDKENAELRRQLEEAQQQLACLQGGFDLAADGSPNRGKALRDHFDSVEQENQDTA